MKKSREDSVTRILPITSTPELGVSLVHSWTDGKISESCNNNHSTERYSHRNASLRPTIPLLSSQRVLWGKGCTTSCNSLPSPTANNTRLIKETLVVSTELRPTRVDSFLRWFSSHRGHQRQDEEGRAPSPTSLSSCEFTSQVPSPEFDDGIERQNKRDEVKEIKKTLGRTCLRNFLLGGRKECSKEETPEGGICCLSIQDAELEGTMEEKNTAHRHQLSQRKTSTTSEDSDEECCKRFFSSSPSTSSSKNSLRTYYSCDDDIDRLIQITPSIEKTTSIQQKKRNHHIPHDDNNKRIPFRQEMMRRNSHQQDSASSRKKSISSFRGNLGLKKSRSNFEMASLFKASTESLRRRSALFTKGHLSSAFTLNEEEEDFLDTQFILSSHEQEEENLERDVNEEKRSAKYDYSEEMKHEKSALRKDEEDNIKLSPHSTLTGLKASLHEVNSRTEQSFLANGARDPRSQKLGSTASTNDAQLTSVSKFCPLCFEKLPSTNFVTLSSCGCAFCRKCLTSYLTTSIRDNISVPFLSCPDAECPQSRTTASVDRTTTDKKSLRRSFSFLSRKSEQDTVMSSISNIISRDQVKNLVDEKTLKLYDKLMLDWSVERDPFKTYCPTPNCDNVCIITKSAFTSIKSTSKDGETTLTTSATLSSLSSVSPAVAAATLLTAKKEKPPSLTPVHCSKCGKDFCFMCRKSFHPGLPCSSSTEEDIKAFMTTAGLDVSDIKKCPRCSVWIERDDGCAQMMCKKCRHVFCWFCLQSLEDDFLLRHYDRGPCKNKLGHSRASVLWHRTQVVGIFAGFGVLLLLASPLFLLIAPCLLCCNCCCRKRCRWLSEEEVPPRYGGSNSRYSMSSTSSTSSAFPPHYKGKSFNVSEDSL